MLLAASDMRKMSNNVERHGLGHLPSRLAASILQRKDAGPMRPVGRRRGCRPGGLYYSAKLGALIGYESDNEKCDCYRAEVDPDVVGYREQPHTIEAVIDGSLRRYTPDREDRYADGRVEIVEVKDDFEADADPDYTLKLEYFAEVYERLGWSFRLTTRDEIKDSATFGTVELIQRYRRVSFTPTEIAAVREFVSPLGKATIASLTPLFEVEAAAVAKLCAMMVARVVVLDLTSRLAPSSAVWLVS